MQLHDPWYNIPVKPSRSVGRDGDRAEGTGLRATDKERMKTRISFLMCPPHFFGVEYVINPWMQGKLGDTQRPLAEAQWNALHTLLTERLGADVLLVPPQARLPDLVFTANAGLVHSGVCIPSRFRHPERQGEEPLFRAWFEAAGYTVTPLPAGIAFEGAGDALFDEGAAALHDQPILWAAHGFRSDRAAHPLLADIFDAEVLSLGLVDPRFYHLDTCFCPLPGGQLLWYPPAFDAASVGKIEARVPRDRRIAVCAEDAGRFACNAVAFERPGGAPAVVLNAASEALREALEARGFSVHETPLTEFLKAGGAAKCLTLRLDTPYSSSTTGTADL